MMFEVIVECYKGLKIVNCLRNITMVYICLHYFLPYDFLDIPFSEVEL